MLQRLDTTARPERPVDDEPTTRTRPIPPPEPLAVTPAPERLHSTPLPERPRLELSIPKVLAGALAAASAAVAASWLGVAGTVIGAVIASVVVSVTTALYSHPLERGSQAIREVMPVVPTRYRAADAAGTTETIVLDASEPRSEVADTSLAPQPRGRVRWATVALSSIVMVVVGFAVITGVEAVLGRPVSAIGGDGGTTLGRIVHHSNGGSGQSDSTQSSGGQSGDSTQSPSTGPTDSPTTGTPTTGDPTTDEPTQPDPTQPEPTQPTGTGPTTAPATGAGIGAGNGGATVAP